MAGAGSSLLYSFLLFIATLSLQEIYREKLASSELFTILGGFTSSLIFLMLLTFVGNYQETCGVRTGWGTVIIAEAVALIAASRSSSLYHNLLSVFCCAIKRGQQTFRNHAVKK
ncbi:hypothetical protein CDL12_05279 [Handroanthus impetiginosus]|uniref:Uncharacterized protein n=1 Tax=Handroanthus impetiginosus TaxID=429701 RepID=A0A2G9HWX4_9LAMI|nr:hypothetical protein CDL12_05279 [Handroanthus impetiginosus]